MRATPAGGERGVSPVVGAVLLVAIVVVLAAISGAAFLALTDDDPPAPTVVLRLEAADGGGYLLRHVSGDVLDGDRLRLRGVADPDRLAGRELAAGDAVLVAPRESSVRVVWREADRLDPVTYTLATFQVDPVSPSLRVSFPDGAVFTGASGDVRRVAGDGGGVTTLGVSGQVAALGPVGGDVTGDGRPDLPYVTDSGAVRVVDASGDVTTVATSGDFGDAVGTARTRVAIGTWQGTRSVFFVDDGHDTIHRARPGTSPSVVASPGDGAQAIVGTGDVDADGTAELVYLGASQQVHYLEPGGSVVELPNGGAGANNGAGADLTTFGGTLLVVFVDGSNDVVVNQEASGGGTTTLTTPDAAKAPIAGADVDGDGATELVYVQASSGDLRYVDDPLGSPTVETLSDASGNAVAGSDETGVT